MLIIKVASTRMYCTKCVDFPTIGKRKSGAACRKVKVSKCSATHGIKENKLGNVRRI